MNESAVDIVKEFYARMNTNDFRAASQLLSDDYVLEWPQSKERIRGRDNFVKVNEEYPAYGIWRFIINRIVGNDSEAASDVSVTDGVQAARAITFSTIRGGKIIHQVEFWPEDYKAPENRRHLVEMMVDDDAG
jgi:ketosteroid isomerase-like protein